MKLSDACEQVQGRLALFLTSCFTEMTKTLDEETYQIFADDDDSKLISKCIKIHLKTFQNLRVSSPAPVTIASPSGDIAR